MKEWLSHYRTLLLREALILALALYVASLVYGQFAGYHVNDVHPFTLFAWFSYPEISQHKFMLVIGIACIALRINVYPKGQGVYPKG